MTKPMPTPFQRSTPVTLPDNQIVTNKDITAMPSAYAELSHFINKSLYAKKATARTIGRDFSKLIDCFKSNGYEVYGPRSKDGDIHHALVQIMKCVRKKCRLSSPSEFNPTNIVDTKHPARLNYVNRQQASSSNFVFFKRGETICAFERPSYPIEKMDLAKALKFVETTMKQRAAMRPSLLIAKIMNSQFTNPKV